MKFRECIALISRTIRLREDRRFRGADRFEIDIVLKGRRFRGVYSEQLLQVSKAENFEPAHSIAWHASGKSMLSPRVSRINIFDCLSQV